MQNKEAYLDSVCREIKFRAARKYLRNELAAHIDDKAEELKKEGVSDPEESAVAAMGDAVGTGRALNKAHRPRTEWGVIACVMILSIASYIIYMYSTANDIAFASGWENVYQIYLFTFGLCAMAAAYFFNYELLFKLRFVFFAAASALLVFDALISWFSNHFLMSTLSFAPTFSLLLFLLAAIGFIGNNTIRSFKDIIRVTVLCGSAIAIFGTLSSSLEVDIFTVICIFILGNVIFHIQRKYLNRLLYLLASAGIILAFYILSLNIREIINLSIIDKDIKFYIGLPLFPSYDEGLPGVRLMLDGAQFIGPSPQYLSHQTYNLSGSRSSFVLTAIIGAYGWLAGIGIILIFLALLIFMFVRSKQVQHHFGRLLATGISLYFLIKFIIFMLSNLCIYTGFSCGLPFFSVGNSDYMVSSVLVGIFLSVWRRSSFMKGSAGLKTDPPAVAEKA